MWWLSIWVETDVGKWDGTGEYDVLGTLKICTVQYDIVIVLKIIINLTVMNVGKVMSTFSSTIFIIC